jgi:hypothetical protein
VLFEMAYARWHAPEYMAVLEKYQARKGPGALATLMYGEWSRPG